MSISRGDLAAAASQLSDQARLLAAQAAGGPAAGTEPDAAAGAADAAPVLGMVRLAGELRTLADAALRLTVERASAAGSTWQEIGGLLGMSPETAFQRFGRPATPGTSEPAAPVITDAAERAITVLTDWFEGRYETVEATFDAAMTEELPADRLAEARTQLAGTAGEYRRLGDDEPLVWQRGDYTVADVPLEFEVGMMKGRVAFDRAGRVAGLFVLPPATP